MLNYEVGQLFVGAGTLHPEHDWYDTALSLSEKGEGNYDYFEELLFYTYEGITPHFYSAILDLALCRTCVIIDTSFVLKDTSKVDMYKMFVTTPISSDELVSKYLWIEEGALDLLLSERFSKYFQKGDKK